MLRRTHSKYRRLGTHKPERFFLSAPKTATQYLIITAVVKANTTSLRLRDGLSMAAARLFPPQTGFYGNLFRHFRGMAEDISCAGIKTERLQRFRIAGPPRMPALSRGTVDILQGNPPNLLLPVWPRPGNWLYCRHSAEEPAKFVIWC